MSAKKIQTFFFSVFGIAAMLAILVAVNFILSGLRVRKDLTEDKVYTLSDGTREILKKIDTKVKIRFYYTQKENQMPVMLKNYARRIEDLLVEYRQAAPKFIEIEKLDPQPDTDAEDSANLDGVDGQMIQTGEKIYLGVSISSLDQKVALPFLSPDRERQLEYDLSRAISRVARPEKPVVGVMSALPVFGQAPNPMMMRMGQQGQQQPEWTAISELKQDFEVKEIEMTAGEIPSDVTVLVVIHPRGITEATEYAIDQFLMRGGRLIAFLDPISIIDRQNTGGNPMMGGGPQTSSGLDRLTKAWGLNFDKGKVVADSQFVSRMMRGNQVENAPAVLSLTAEAVSTNDIATGEIDSLLLPFAGSFSGTVVAGLTQTVLLHSSKASQIVDGFMAQMGGQSILQNFQPSNTEQSLAVKLTGKFKTAFPDGKPGATPDVKKDGDEKKDDGKKAEHLKEGKEEGAVVLVADSDMLFDQFCVRVQNMLGMRIVTPMNANLTFLQNVVEQLSGDSSLINTRTRGIKQRPFTLIAKMQNEAQDKFRSRIKELEDSLQETQRRLNELQRTKEDANQRFILSPEQKKELENFRQKQVDTNKELKNLRKDLRREIVSLQNKLKWVNIAGMPVVVTVFGLLLGFIKRQRTAAK